MKQVVKLPFGIAAVLAGSVLLLDERLTLSQAVTVLGRKRQVVILYSELCLAA